MSARTRPRPSNEARAGDSATATQRPQGTPSGMTADASPVLAAGRGPISKPDLGGGVSHPARFSDAILARIAEVVDALPRRSDRPLRLLDPFAGTGRVHELRDRCTAAVETIGVELEPEWAQLSPYTIIGSALALPFTGSTFDVVATSPCYGNRLADHHNASDPHLRRSYRHDLGRPLSDGNAGAMQWGDEYRTFHVAAWGEALRVLRPGGTLVVNVKDHVRRGEVQPVTAWHLAVLVDLGMVHDAEASVAVATRHLRQGANRGRAGDEQVLVFRKPGEVRR